MHQITNKPQITLKIFSITYQTKWDKINRKLFKDNKIKPNKLKKITKRKFRNKLKFKRIKKILRFYKLLLIIMY